MSKAVDGYESVLKHDLEELLLASGAQSYFDSKYYVASNEDVKLEVEAGRTTALNHYLKNGFSEGRAPFDIKVNEGYYLKNNPDVAIAIQDGRCESAQHHYDAHGRREGRSPYEMATEASGGKGQMSTAANIGLRDKFRSVKR